MNSLLIVNRQNLFLVILGISTPVILTFSFPPFPFGVLACVGFVPFLIMSDAIQSFGRYIRYAYGTFFLLSLMTLYWVGGFTHMQDQYLMIAGIALFFWQPLVFTIPALVYFFIRKRMTGVYGAAVFPFVWVTMEWLYTLGELAFPWLHIGNTQTYQLEKIQFADITGVYGISFWLLSINVLVYVLVKHVMVIGYRIDRKGVTISLLVLFLYILPNFYRHDPSSFRLSGKNPITVGVVQPNIDPWDKWEGANTFSGRWMQVERYLSLIRTHVNDSVDLAVLPESAILLNLPALYPQMKEFKETVDSLNLSVISGYVRVQYYEFESAPPTSSTIKGTNVRYDSFNSILFVEPGVDRVQSYSKMRLVPFAERIPYADKVPFLIEPLRWGVGISNWGLSRDSTIFTSMRLNSQFLAMVCYESIFPEFVAEFVKKGAEFLVFTTNDSWWGNTSGARQHNQYAILRAIENRRWVVRCANGGISSFVDPFGTMYQKTSMYTEAYIQQSIQPLQDLTFYSRHGDLFARICASISAFIFLFSIGYSVLRK